MAQSCNLTPLSTLIQCNADKTINLNYTSLQIGYEFIVVDDLALASMASPITVVCKLTSGGSSVQISDPGGQVRLTWQGAGYGLG